MPWASSLRGGSRRGKHRKNRVINRKTRMCRVLDRSSSGREETGWDEELQLWGVGPVPTLTSWGT